MSDEPKPDLGTVLQHYGAEWVPDHGYNRSMNCPFHDDRHRSASVNIDEQVFQCFTCGVKGDVYSLVMHKEGVDFVEAKRRAEAIAGTGSGEVRAEPRQGRFLSVGQRAYQGKRPGAKARRSRRPRTWS